jgi:peptide/nickel transport system substrate-binding protein
MFKLSRTLPIVSPLLTFTVLLAGCGAPSAAQPTAEIPAADVATVQSGATAAPPAAAPTSAAATQAPTTAAVVAGQGGTLKLLWFQAPTILNPHLSTGTKDFDAARVVYEPLASFDRDGKLVPFLAAEIPSLENGGLAEDGTSVTWKLKEGVQWADGTPFTAADVQFTYEFIADPETAATTAAVFSAVENVEVINDLTVKVNFKNPNPAWSLPFVGTNGLIIPKHLFEAYVGAKAREAPNNLLAIGTGPYQSVEFKPGDIAIYEPNPYFREEGKPFFSRVELKGGGDPATAARAVLQTGEVDFIPTVNVERQLLDQLLVGSKAELITNSGGALSERIELNRADPNTEVDGERSSASVPHPFFSDLKVRQAFALAVDRQTIADQVYGPPVTPNTNALIAPPQFVSPNTSWEFNLEKAAALLDEAGWVDSDGDGIRDKDGVKLSILYQTSTIARRQKVQEVIKQSLESIGWQVELKSVDNGVFFSSDPANTDTFNHFYADVQMYTIGNYNPDPAAYLESFTCAKIVSKATNWTGGNRVRYCNPAYDAIFEQARSELDPAKRAELFIQLNDILVNDVVIIPLVLSGVNQAAATNGLTGITLSPWESSLWLLKDWTRVTS